MGIFFDKIGDYAPTVYEQWLCKFRAQMDLVVLMHLRALGVPHVKDEDKYVVARTSVRNVYRLIIRHGYNDHVITPDLARVVYEEVRRAILHDAIKSSPSEGSRADKESLGQDGTVQDAALIAGLRHLDEAYQTQTLYLVGKQQMRVSTKYAIPKRMALGVFLWVRENCRGRIEKLNVPVEKLVEVGFVKEI